MDIAKQDRNGVRTAQNIEQKYKLGTVKKEITIVKETTDSQQFEFDKKVDKVAGKGLSTNDFTDEYIEKIDTYTIPEGGKKNQILYKKNDTDGDYDWKDETYSIDNIYPIGTIYVSINNTNPSKLFSGTTWEQVTNSGITSVYLFKRIS